MLISFPKVAGVQDPTVELLLVRESSHGTLRRVTVTDQHGIEYGLFRLHGIRLIRPLPADFPLLHDFTLFLHWRRRNPQHIFVELDVAAETKVTCVASQIFVLLRRSDERRVRFWVREVAETGHLLGGVENQR